jgi:nucleoside-diphosphate-sugar epimerase
MSKINLENPVIPLDSLILVTGINGYVASHVADQFMFAGYRVRGTVRDLSKATWISELFTSRHGPGRVELVAVPDITAPGAWDNAIRGVAGVASVASPVELQITDANAAMAKDKAAQFSLLAAAQAEGVKSFAYTSSFWAAHTPHAGVPITIPLDSWNDEAIKLALDPNVPQEMKGFAPYMAGKTMVEKEIWAWVEREKPSFIFNAILPGTALGPILADDHQSGSTAGLLRGIWKNDPVYRQIVGYIEPQWVVDVRDNARVNVAAMTTAGVSGERICALGDKYSWPRVMEIIKEKFPERLDLEYLPAKGWDESVVPNKRALELLRLTGQDSWNPLEQIVKDTVDSFSK